MLAATVQDGIFRSTDRGVRWTGWNFGLYDPNINLLAVADSQEWRTPAFRKWRLLAARPGFEPASNISALTTPLGLDPAKPLLVGLSNGDIIKL